MGNNPRVKIIPATKTAKRIKTVGIYARVSTARKEQLRSLATQISALTRHVSTRNDWLLKDIYMDVGSAKTGADRREFTRMLRDCTNHELDYIITKSLSRFGRDSVEVLEAVRQLLSSGVKIYFMEEDINIDRNYDEVELSLRAALNQSENEHRSENIKLGLKYRAENGLSGLYKKPCFGYKKNENGDLVQDSYQAAVVRKIYELYLSGLSFEGLIGKLAKEGIPSPHGCEKWSKKAIETILTNIKYTGNVEVLKTDPGRASYCMCEAHEAIISTEEFAQVQSEIVKRSKRKRKVKSAANIFVDEINWSEPFGDVPIPNLEHEINYPEPKN